MKRNIITALSIAISLAATGTAWAQSQGVGKDRIVIGTIQDLSGPIAAYGKQARQGMQLRIDELNEQGGVHGRRITLLVEDSAYDPKRAVLAAQKLVNQDKIFAMLGHLGSAHNMAAMPVQFERSVPNVLPLNAAREMYEPHHRLKYAFFAPYFDQVRAVLPRIAKEKGLTKICTLYQDDEFGLEVMRGTEAAVKQMSLGLIEKTSFKRGATDFSSQVARMKSAGCELVVLGTIIRETVGAIAEARKTGFNPVFLGTAAAYTELIPRLGGKAMDGMFATMTTQLPYPDDASPELSFWAKKYKTRYGDDPSMFSAYGYVIADILIKGLVKAGPNLSADSFVKAMDSLAIPPDIFGSPEMTFSSTKRLGSNASRLSQLQDGRWQIVSKYLRPD